MKSEVKRGQNWTYERMLFFPKIEYAKRRARLWEEWSRKKPILLLGCQKESDGQFKQWSTFEYFTGYREPMAWMILLPRGARGFESHLFIPPINERIRMWEGNRFDPTKAHTHRALGVDQVHSTENFESFIKKRMRGQKTVGAYVTVDRYNKELKQAPATLELKGFLKKFNLKFESISYIANELRRIKSPLEIETLRRADAITGASIRNVLGQWSRYRNECEIQGDIEGGFRKNGALELAYAPIVGAGFNATVLHYRNNDFALRSSQVVLMDVGCRYRGYCADITRDFPRSGRFSKRQREVYEIVLESQLRGIRKVRPGLTWEELNDTSWGYLKEHGFERWHGVGHFLGMDVHDVGDYKKPLEPGNIITVEPGVYLPDEGLGIRIEDDVLVTKNGCRVLSSMIPKRVEEIQRLMK